jgi:predicted acylesterase/phospholipase RssA
VSIAAQLDQTEGAPPKLGLAFSGGGHRAAFFHIGVLAKLAELGLLRRIEVLSTVSGGSIVGALYYLHIKNLLEDKADDAITDADYITLVRELEQEYREAAATNVRASAWANLGANFKMVKPTYSRSDRVGEIYEQRFYAKPWRDRPKRDGRIAMRDLLIQPNGHDGAFDPDVDNASRRARVPILLLEATTLNTGHNWRFEALYMGEPPRQGTSDEAERADVDKNVILQRTRWDALPASCQNFPLGAAVAASACFPGGFPPIQVPGLFNDLVVELIDGGVHDNQGLEGLLDRGCTHLIISDGSGQMPDKVRPSTRLPAVLGRVVSIYGDAEREQRLLAALQHRDRVAFMHLQTGIPATTRAPNGQTATAEPKMETTEFGVQLEVQRALANIRTDLDAFNDTEASALMADGYQLAGRIVPTRSALAALTNPAPTRAGWAFDAIGSKLAATSADPQLLKLLQVAKERFLKPTRMTAHALAIVNVLLAAAAAAALAALWLLLTPHGTTLFIVGLAILVALILYATSDKAYVKPVAIAVFDVFLPLLLAIPLIAVAALQLASGRLWLARGRISDATHPAPASSIAEPPTP